VSSHVVAGRLPVLQWCQELHEGYRQVIVACPATQVMLVTNQLQAAPTGGPGAIENIMELESELNSHSFQGSFKRNYKF